MVLVIMEIPQSQFIDKVIDVGYAGPANSGVALRRQSRSHSCGSSYSFDNVVEIPVVAQMLIPLRQGGGRARDALWPMGTDSPATGDAASKSF